MILALTELQGYVIVGVITAVIPLGSAYLAYRATRKTGEVSATQGAIELALKGQQDLITDLRAARDEDRREFREALAGVNRKLEACEEDREEDRRRWEREKVELTERIDELERAA